MKTHLLTIACCLCLSVACQKNDRLQTALNHAGENRMELEKVLHHYEGDTLKPRAARFLIENMPYHFSLVEELVSSDGVGYYPDITRFAGEESVKRHCDSLYFSGYRLQRKYVYDIHTLTADYLIDQIDLAFEVWQKPWSKGVPFDDFCRHILPYRVENERLASLRKVLKDKYLPLLDSAGVTTVKDACRVMNGQLRKDLLYLRTGNPLKATIEQTHRSGIGTCDDLSNYAVHAMRSVGIPITRKQTKWTRNASSHFWVSVLHEDGFFDYNPGEVVNDSFPYELADRPFLRPAKIYRREYLAESVLPSACDDGYVTYLKNPLLRDVTEEQLASVYTLRVPLSGNVSVEAGRQLYLCSFNEGHWEPLALGRNEDGTAVFPKVAGRNFFIVAEYRDGRLRFLTFPFATSEDGTIRVLDGTPADVETYTFDRVRNRPMTEVGYWDHGLSAIVDLSCESYTDTTQTYHNVPKNAFLYVRRYTTPLSLRYGIIDNGVYKNNKDW